MRRVRIGVGEVIRGVRKRQSEEGVRGEGGGSEDGLRTGKGHNGEWYGIRGRV